jgi:hypothetical protein
MQYIEKMTHFTKTPSVETLGYVGAVPPGRFTAP